MRHIRISVFLVACAAIPLFAGDETNRPAPSQSSLTNRVERIEAKVLKVYSVKDGDADFRAYAILWKGQEVIAGDMSGDSAYQVGDIVKVGVMKLPRYRGGQPHEVLMFQIFPSAGVPVFKPVPRADQSPARHAVFFECRNNELFCIEKDELEAQIVRALAAEKQKAQENPVLALQGKEIGNDHYTVDLTGLSLALLRVVPRPKTHGEGSRDLARPESKFQKTLQRLHPEHDSIVFMVREDSAGACDQARQIAEAAGFTTTSQTFAPDKPLTFGR